MNRQDDYIVKCAKRLVDKLNAGDCYKYNGEFQKPVQVEIERMKKHCNPQHNGEGNE